MTTPARSPGGVPIRDNWSTEGRVPVRPQGDSQRYQSAYPGGQGDNGLGRALELGLGIFLEGMRQSQSPPQYPSQQPYYPPSSFPQQHYPPSIPPQPLYPSQNPHHKEDAILQQQLLNSDCNAVQQNFSQFQDMLRRAKKEGDSLASRYEERMQVCWDKASKQTK